jgi:hypothetical protein
LIRSYSSIIFIQKYVCYATIIRFYIFCNTESNDAIQTGWVAPVSIGGSAKHRIIVPTAAPKDPERVTACYMRTIIRLYISHKTEPNVVAPISRAAIAAAGGAVDGSAERDLRRARGARAPAGRARRDLTDE